MRFYGTFENGECSQSNKTIKLFTIWVKNDLNSKTVLITQPKESTGRIYFVYHCNAYRPLW